MMTMAAVISAITWGPGRATVPSGPGEALSQGLSPRGGTGQHRGGAGLTEPAPPPPPPGPSAFRGRLVDRELRLGMRGGRAHHQGQAGDPTSVGGTDLSP